MQLPVTLEPKGKELNDKERGPCSPPSKKKSIHSFLISLKTYTDLTLSFR
jgi:hypothetical protein